MKERIQKAWRRFSCAAVEGTLRALTRLAYRPKVTYTSEKARQEAFSTPQLLVCNHVRGMDGVVMGGALRGLPITALSAKDVQETYPVLKVLFRYLPVIEIDRQHVSLSWLRESRQCLRAGRHVMIFAEGKCNRARVLQPLKSGFVTLAVSANVQVTPIYHNGAYHPFFGPRFRMLVGEPISLVPPEEGVSAEWMEAESRRLFHIMQAMEREMNGRS